MPTSQNGYPANDRSVADTFTVPGSKVRLVLRRGPVADVLLYVASRFDSEVEDIDTAGTYIADAAPSIPGGEPSKLADDWSYAERPIRGSSTTLSNHASATAVDLNATQHPRGVRGTFTATQVARVRRILAHTVGPTIKRPVIRWGEDYKTAPVDGMHFEADAAEPEMRRVADILKALAAGKLTRTLGNGDAGPDVAALQAALGIPVDGIAGPQTERGIVTARARLKLPAGKLCDAALWAALNSRAPAPAKPATSTGGSVTDVRRTNDMYDAVMRADALPGAAFTSPGNDFVTVETALQVIGNRSTSADKRAERLEAEVQALRADVAKLMAALTPAAVVDPATSERQG